MRTYTEIVFQGTNEEVAAVLIAELADKGYGGFLEEDDKVITYIDSEMFDETTISELATSFGLQISLGSLPEQNWNATWESSFSPVMVDNRISIRASFHQPVAGVEKEIIITPKMSFGTGHHSTTYLMVKEMLELSFTNRTVLDFGTGTGILAILAELLGASEILGIDNDPWSIENATENLQLNTCTRTQLELGSTLPDGRKFDVILANINRHILLEHADQLTSSLNAGGNLLLSGILTEDREVIVDRFREKLGDPVAEEQQKNWMMIRFQLNVQ